MSVVDDVRRTIALYSQLLDDKRFAEWGDLFTVDAVFEARGTRLVGRDQIVEWISEVMVSASSKHLIGACVIDLIGDDRARAWTDLTTFSALPDGIAVATVGRYHDELRREPDGRWRFAQRIMVRTGDTPPDDVVAPPGA